MAANFMRLSMLIRLVSLAAVVSSASGQFHLGPKSRQPSPTPPPMRKASDLIRRQEALRIGGGVGLRSEEHTSELQSRPHLVCRLLLEKKKKKNINRHQTHQHYDSCT